MDFTVIVCTYNRSANLPRCLDALAKQQDVEDREWEVLVVDNNSTDDTSEIVADLARKLPINVRYEREPEQGLNYARNTGIRKSDGKYFSYVDDDILVSRNWLSSLLESFEANDADAVGGRIHLDPSIILPKWIGYDTDMMGFLGYQDFGDIPLRLDGRRQYPFGGNMSFNRRVVDRIGYFNPKIGRKGTGQKRSELFKGAETDYFHRLASSGEVRIYYAPDAIVYHQVMPFQLKKKYFRDIHFNAGYQKAAFDMNDYPRTLAGVPLFLFGQFARAVTRYGVQLLSVGPNTAFRQQMNIGYFLGMIMSYYKRRTKAE